jgi:hypothetical protein
MSELSQFDVLTDAELGIAREESTAQETAALSFDKGFPREYPFGLRNVYYYYWRLWADRALRARLGGDFECIENFSRAMTNYWPGLRSLHLSNVIQNRKPKLVYEFGLGVSTVLIATWLRKVHRETGIAGRVVSFVQSEGYFRAAEAAFSDELCRYADLRLNPLQLKWYGAYRGLSFRDVPLEDSIDLVYVYGPTRPRGDERSNFVFRRSNADLVNLYQGVCRIVYAITDHRWANFPFFRDFLSGDFHVTCSRCYKSIIIEPKT